YIFRRGDERIYELHGGQVEIVDAPLVWPVGAGQPRDRRDNEPKREVRANPNRAYDNDILSEFYRGVRPFSNAKLGMYWRGPLELLDGSKVEVVLLASFCLETHAGLYLQGFHAQSVVRNSQATKRDYLGIRDLRRFI